MAPPAPSFTEEDRGGERERQGHLRIVHLAGNARALLLARDLLVREEAPQLARLLRHPHLEVIAVAAQLGGGAGELLALEEIVARGYGCRGRRRRRSVTHIRRLNLPAEDKLVPPHFAMPWSGEIPRRSFADEAGRATEVTVIARHADGRVERVER